jgi:hypothetical protein
MCDPQRFRSADFAVLNLLHDRSSIMSSLRDVFGCGTIAPCWNVYCAWLTLVGALSVPPAPQFGPGLNLRTSNSSTTPDSETK